MKKLKSFKLMLLGLVALISSSAFAQGSLHLTTQYGENGFKYKILSIYKNSSATKVNTVSVSQNVYAAQGKEAMVIPATVDIYVKGTDDEATPVAVDQKITFKIVEIEDNAFAGVTKATSIQIGSNVKTIGANAFDGCSKVTSVTFDANANDMTIGVEAFKGVKVTSLDLSPITGTLDAVNKWWDNTAFVAGTEVNSTLETITFPRKVTTIVADAFAGFTALKDVNFTAQVDKENEKLVIEAGAFQETAIENFNLTEARIYGTAAGNGLNKLFEDDNVTLKTVTMSKYVEQLNENALANCIQLNSVNFSQSSKLKTLANGSLSNTVVANYDFSKCYELNKAGTAYSTNFLNFAEGVNPFVNATTKTNKNLVTVTLPKAESLAWSPVTVIGTTFANCEVLTTITNLDLSKITDVKDGAFANDISLTELTFPNTLVNVLGAPFAGCKTLATLNFDGTALKNLGTVAVKEEKYTAETATAYNMDLPGAKKYGYTEPAVYTAVAASTTLTSGGTYYTSIEGAGEFKAVGTEVADGTNYFYLVSAEKVWSNDEVDNWNAKVPGAVKAGDIKTPGVAGGDLFGDYTHVTAWSPLTTKAFDAPLKTLNIFVTEADKTISTAINEDAFSGNGEDNSVLQTINIGVAGTFGGKTAVAATFAGTVAEDAIILGSKENAAVAFGDIDGATFNPMGGLKGTATATLTTGTYTTATLSGAIIAGNITVATIGKVAGGMSDNVLTAIGQAAKIVFGDIAAAIAFPGAPNNLLTEIEFNGVINDAADMIPATAFDENNAPLLTAVKYQPETATAKVFNIKAFGTKSMGVDAKITLTTITAIKALYDNKEANLYNIKLFVAEDPEAEPVEIAVYGNAGSEYFYGKIKNATKLSISKANAEGDQVEVYSAFVDSKDQKIYMDRLALREGNYIVAEDQPVIIRVKAPTTTEAYDKIEGGLKAVVKAYETKLYSTMRYRKTGKSDYSILNDLQVTDKVFSSDYIGTTYVGKTLFAMANPAKVGTLQFDPVAKTSYLPKGALFVETVEGASSARPMEIIWLDGEEDYTGIIESVKDINANEGAVYNLQGVRVSGAQKGIYIKNGKKFIVK